ncbi:NYN domain-containing protein [Amnibacterium setariae]|uniref:NYN domain-containing protein n=1 Tax=Amnibacterium setariae TaxID=2306585 RepID=A0A3A1U221_9MICO|nr:NYN domain-containing protein [Amnibacterium setariae]
MRDAAPVAERITVLIDGENLDTTLGTSILQRAPRPADRPRWERVLEFARGLRGQEAVGLFFINATSGNTPWPFVAAIQNAGFRAVLLAGTGHEKVVDVGIQRTLEALADRDDDVIVGSHDRDFAPQVEQLLGGDREVAMLGFPEMMSGVYAELGVRTYDLEYDVHAFNQRLPRIRVIPIGEFDPEEFLA